MYQSTLLERIIWLINPLVIFVCAYLVRRRGEGERFPGFFYYLLFNGTRSYLQLLVLWIWGFRSNQYFYVFWAGEMMAICLCLVVIRDVVKDVSTSCTFNVNAGKTVALSMLAMSGVIYIAIALTATVRDPVLRAILVADDMLRLSEICLLLGLALLTAFFGFYWGRLAFGIVAGFSMVATADLVAYYIVTHVGQSTAHLANLMTTMTYTLAVQVWFFYLWRKPKSHRLALPSDKVSGYTLPIEILVKK